MKRSSYDAVVIGSGPNGLSAGITLAREGLSVLLIEANDEIGGGLHSREITLPGLIHDICSAVHPTALASPFFRSLDLQGHGVEWVWSPYELAHPFDEGPPALLLRSLDETAARFGTDGPSWKGLFQPYLKDADAFFDDALRGLHVPKHPFLLARFGLTSLRSAQAMVDARFSTAAPRAIFAGCAAHAIVPLDWFGTAAVGMMLAASGHAYGWPIARGGSREIGGALETIFTSLGGEIVTGWRVKTAAELPEAKGWLFDLTPRQVVSIAGDQLPSSYVRRLQKFRYGEGVYKVDYALSAPIPWKSPECREALTVHLGGTFEEVALSEQMVGTGKHPEKPFVIVSQPTLFDRSRTTGPEIAWAYCHVPHGSDLDMTATIERQIERFAPGFSDVVLQRSVRGPAVLERENANLIGGDIAGGMTSFSQLFTRPVARIDPYSTPNPKIFFCSSSTPPGGGVHGMCGYLGARSALRRVWKK